MRGVRKDKRHGGWIVNYGKSVKLHFKTEKEAVNERKILERQFGKLTVGPKRKDYSGKSFGNFKVVGSTGEYKGHSQLAVVKNVKTKRYRTIVINNLLSGSTKGNYGYSRKQKNNTTGFSGVMLKKTGIYKGMYFGSLTINGKTYVTPFFKDPQKAYEEKEKKLKSYLEKGILPKPNKTKASTGRKYIHFEKRKGRTPKYTFEIERNRKRKRERFNTLNEAVAYRDKFLKEHNLPIPD